MNISNRLEKPELCIRIVVCDYYLAKPTPGIDVIYSEFRGADIKQVPVIRIFGSTPSGHKACLHVHGVFPYFYIPCPSANPEPQLLYQIAASLDKALNIAMKQATSANQHVYKISLVKALPFYGFHDKDHLYLKVFLYNPGLIKQAVELCSNGAILGTPFQPHESHLNFTLQFFIDFNLFGMSNIELQNVLYRKSGCSQNSNDPLDSNDEAGLKPESVCHYEADCLASHIINRQRVGRGEGIENPGLEEVWQQEMDRRKELNVSMASKSLSQGRFNADETESHYKFEQMFMIKITNLIDKPVIVDGTENVYYPAESMEGSQLIDAVDVSVHVPDTTLGMSLSESIRRSADDTLTDFLDETIVDEVVALNSSLHFSQVLLNTEDLELLDLLQDMDEQPVEDDSILATPATNDEEEPESDDADYSQAFNDTTIFLDAHDNKDDTENNSPNWNDSFWDGANIPQLDGTCDDDHVKKVRKRKMRPFKLGLSRPRSKKTNSNKQIVDSKSETSDGDEINESRETISNISDSHLKRVVKIEQENIIKDSRDGFEEVVIKSEIKNESVTNLINNMSVKVTNIKGPAEIYDLQNNYVPLAGPSKIKRDCDMIQDDLLNNSYDTSPEEDKLGIMSFYNKSNLCDITFDSPNELSEIQDSNEVVNNFNEFGKTVKADPQIDIRNSKLICDSRIIITPKIRPPSKNYIVSTLQKYIIPQVRNPKPYFSDHKDVGDKIDMGHMVLKTNSKLAKDQKPFEKVLDTVAIEEWRQLLFLQTNETADECAKPEALKSLLAGNTQYILQPLKRPPTKYEVVKWIEDRSFNIKLDVITKDEIKQKKDDLDSSQAIGLNEDEINNSISLERASQVNKEDTNSSLQVSMQTDGSFLCFGAECQKDTSSIEATVVETDFLTLMLTEVLTSVRGDLNPDPMIDAIQAIFITVKNDCPPNHFLNKLSTELYVVDPSTSYLDKCVFDTKITYVRDECEILEKVIELVKRHDPDIMCGYEIEMNSWGYIMERAQVLGLEVVQEISRITEKNRQKRWRGDDNDFEGRIIGRIMFNVWRLFRHELALSSYSFENCMFVILNERVPKYSYGQLWKWWSHESRMLRWIPVEYFLTRLNGTVRMLDKLDIINRTSELARLFGLQWWEVLSRGSQFRVESLMLRSARPLNLVALSPTVKQRAAMRAPECLPLIFEPESRFYADPVIVLDFQSLYPSMMIAYNYCFSTCIGRMQNINGDAAYEFGAWRLRIPKSKLETLVKKGHIHWSPVGVGFVKTSVRRGVLPALLRRILAARQAVKKGMKLQTDEAVKKAMHSRQLGLKLIANVTYGYTAANFSGRMPCVEVGDSVVAKGRETLERAIKLVNNNAQWNVKVVYGDTDSMFVLVPGASREQAFAIGQQIADAVTADNPPPVALKLEKVYQPCILQTKKRYVGFMYESADQDKPVYEAKGIETVRRDGCPAGVKLLQRSLCELFESGDMSRVKRIFMESLSKLINGSMPLHELLFTREYHGAGGYKPGAHAPPYEIAKRTGARDRRAAPRTGERVHWLVTAGAPSAPLVKLARTPAEIHARGGGGGGAPHVSYYALRALIPPMQRCFSLLGHDVTKWWSELNYTRDASARHTVSGIARYMWRERCIVCSARGSRAICSACAAEPRRAAANVACRGANARTLVGYCDLICKSCCGHGQYKQCENYECPVIWRRLTAEQKLNEMQDVVSHLPPQFNSEVIEF